MERHMTDEVIEIIIILFNKTSLIKLGLVVCQYQIQIKKLH